MASGGTIPATQNMAFQAWANSVILSFPYLKFSTPGTENDWRQWVEDLIQQNNLLYLPVPNTYQFPKDSDWQKWGNLFISLYYEENE